MHPCYVNYTAVHCEINHKHDKRQDFINRNIGRIATKYQQTGARRGSARQNICSDGKFGWLENRADISRADNT